MSASEIVNVVWNYAHVLRDDGVGYGDYVEHITYLIFLKMADEREMAGQQVKVPNDFAWAGLVKLDGDDLELQYRHTLETWANKAPSSVSRFNIRQYIYCHLYNIRLYICGNNDINRQHIYGKNHV
jgi:hypothetical protein